jgi:hypothetical protein
MSKFKDTTTAISTIKSNTLATNTSTEIDPFLAYGEGGGGAITGELLKFSKGDFFSGRDNKMNAAGTRLVANMDSLESGWVRWDSGKPVEYRMVRIAKGFTPAQRRDLGDNDRNLWTFDEDGNPRDPWQKTENVVLADPRDGTVYTFTTSSVGGREAVQKLAVDYARARQRHPDKWPVIELGVETYVHTNKTFGRIKTPKFTIVDFVEKGSTAPYRAPADTEAPPWGNEDGDPGFGADDFSNLEPHTP